MLDTLIYKSGNQNLPYKFCFNILNYNDSIVINSTIRYFVELWCQNNCEGQWSILQTYETLIISFNEIYDVVMFYMSKEYSRFSSKNGVIKTLPTTTTCMNYFDQIYY